MMRHTAGRATSIGSSALFAIQQARAQAFDVHFSSRVSENYNLIQAPDTLAQRHCGGNTVAKKKSCVASSSIAVTLVAHGLFKTTRTWFDAPIVKQGGLQKSAEDELVEKVAGYLASNFNMAPPVTKNLWDRREDAQAAFWNYYRWLNFSCTDSNVCALQWQGDRVPSCVITGVAGSGKTSALHLLGDCFLKKQASSDVDPLFFYISCKDAAVDERQQNVNLRRTVFSRVLHSMTTGISFPVFVDTLLEIVGGDSALEYFLLDTRLVYRVISSVLQQARASSSKKPRHVLFAVDDLRYLDPKMSDLKTSDISETLCYELTPLYALSQHSAIKSTLNRNDPRVFVVSSALSAMEPTRAFYGRLVFHRLPLHPLSSENAISKMADLRNFLSTLNIRERNAARLYLWYQHDPRALVTNAPEALKRTRLLSESCVSLVKDYKNSLKSDFSTKVVEWMDKVRAMNEKRARYRGEMDPTDCLRSLFWPLMMAERHQESDPQFEVSLLAESCGLGSVLQSPGYAGAFVFESLYMPPGAALAIAENLLLEDPKDSDLQFLKAVKEVAELAMELAEVTLSGRSTSETYEKLILQTYLCRALGAFEDEIGIDDFLGSSVYECSKASSSSNPPKLIVGPKCKPQVVQQVGAVPATKRRGSVSRVGGKKRFRQEVAAKSVRAGESRYSIPATEKSSEGFGACLALESTGPPPGLISLSASTVSIGLQGGKKLLTTKDLLNNNNFPEARTMALNKTVVGYYLKKVNSSSAFHAVLLRPNPVEKTFTSKQQQPVPSVPLSKAEPVLVTHECIRKWCPMVAYSGCDARVLKQKGYSFS